MKRTNTSQVVPRSRPASLAIAAVFALALLAPTGTAHAQHERPGQKWVDSRGGVPVREIKRTLGMTAVAILGGILVIGWLLRSPE